MRMSININILHCEHVHRKAPNGTSIKFIGSILDPGQIFVQVNFTKDFYYVGFDYYNDYSSRSQQPCTAWDYEHVKSVKA